MGAHDGSRRRRGARDRTLTISGVRIATPADVDACVGLALEAAATERVVQGPEFWRGALTRDLADPNRLLAVAVDDGDVVAYARTHLFEPAADAPADSAPGGYYLIGLFVRPDRRRLGLGAALTAARLRWVGERSDEAWFFANARNTASIELHRRFGFVEVTRGFSFPGLEFPGSEGILFRRRRRKRTGREVALFVTRRDGGEVLLVHRAPERGGYWHVIAGGVEPGETAIEAAERELREETGLVAPAGQGLGIVEYWYALTEEPAERAAHVDPSVSSIRVDCFRVEAPPGWEPTLDAEHDGHRWCSPAEAVRALRWPATAAALEQLLGAR